MTRSMQVIAFGMEPPQLQLRWEYQKQTLRCSVDVKVTRIKCMLKLPQRSWQNYLNNW